MEEDLIARVSRAHRDYLRRLSHSCLLTPELSTIMHDLRQLVLRADEFSRALLVFSSPLDSIWAPATEGGVGGEETTRRKGDEEAEVSPRSGGGVEALGAAGLETELLSLYLRPGLSEAMAPTLRRVLEVQKEFQRGARFFLNVLKFSVAKGTNPKFGDVFTRLNFNRFYIRGI